MNKSKPLVSIITIVFNGAAYIEDTIKSVLNQTYDKIEYIIIDGGSTDGTLEIIEKYNEHVKWISEKDNGISDAFNKGIRLAKGDLIGIINADDWYEPDAVQNIVSCCENECTVICGDVKLYNSKTAFNLKKSTLKGLNKKMTVWHPGMFVPKSVYDKVGLYDQGYKVLMDYDFVVRCTMAGIKFYFHDGVVASMRYGGISNRLISKSMKEALTIKNGHFGANWKNHFEYVYYNIYFQTIIFIKRIIYR